MQALFEFLSVLLFFICFKLFDIYVATVVGIVTSGFQALLYRFIKKQWDQKQIIVFLVFSIFGGMTLYFHNPIFVKWKPTIVFWVFAFALLVSQWITEKPIMQRLLEPALLEKNIETPRHLWMKLNHAWCSFFIILGAINLYVAYYFSNNAWVNFKLYGIMGATLVFAIAQSLYISKHIAHKQLSK